ncbi:MAG TPA: hypothetical protein VMR52_08475 [Dehalococcoidia bacterium]|nr:hypothetical protein [Dehalococcoidia bacterium]
MALATTVLVTVAACGGDDDEAAPPTGSTGYRVTIASPQSLSIGAARFVFLLEDARGNPATNASIRLRFYFIDPLRDNRKTIKNSVSATEVELDRQYSLTQEDGSAVAVGPGPTGVFATEVAFDQPGDWVVDVTGSAGNNHVGVIEAPFQVSEAPLGPRTGQPAPQAITGPAIVSFGQAEVCGSAVCGPLLQLVAEEAAANEGPVALVEGEDPANWGVGDDQAVFFVDGSGIVRGRLDATAARDEVSQKLALIAP